MSSKIFWCLIFAVQANVFAYMPYVQIKTEQGILVGKIIKSQRGRAFYSFTGIPYAKPPVGPLRFEPPVPADPWGANYVNATQPHAMCPQMDFKTSKVIGDEDCLYLNIYTPQLPVIGADLLPVMFFIHGGGWYSGSAQSDFYGPELLLDKDIVLVTANYRLGPLGFFSTGDNTVPGNNGLKDQALVLKWIKENIAEFGGDSKHVTVFGSSSGGTSAHLHMFSPMSRDLVTGAIGQSGNVLSIGSFPLNAVVVNSSRTLAGLLNCPASQTQEMVKCLRNVDVGDITKKTPKSLANEFKPVIETREKGAFLKEHPVNIMVSGEPANGPIMIGVTSDDGAATTAEIFGSTAMVHKLNKNFEEVAPEVLGYKNVGTDRSRKKFSTAMKTFYFGSKPVTSSSKSTFTKMSTEAKFLVPALTSVYFHTQFKNQPLYLYNFAYKGSGSFCPLSGNGTMDQTVVCHGDELLYLFTNKVLFPGYKQTEADRKVTELMTTLWTNFAKYGNPTTGTDLGKWLPARHGISDYYDIRGDSEMEMKDDMQAEFWSNSSRMLYLDRDN